MNPQLVRLTPRHEAVGTVGDRVLASRVVSLDGVTSFSMLGRQIGTRSSLPFVRDVVFDHKGKKLGILKTVGKSQFLERNA